MIRHVFSFGIAVFFSIGCQAGLAQSSSIVTATTGNEPVAHGGGCRKDSPPGKCCHAGSQPFHCH